MADNHPAPDAIDARGLACPLPVLKLRKALQVLPSGTVVELLATDRTALRDIPAFCTGLGHELLETVQEKDLLRFVIRKA